MTRVAFLGLGRMGAPMAGRLSNAGHDLVVWSRTSEHADALADRAEVARSPAEAGSKADVAVTMLTDGGALEEVVLGRNGLADGLAPGTLLIDRSIRSAPGVRPSASPWRPSTTSSTAPPSVSMVTATSALDPASAGEAATWACPASASAWAWVRDQTTRSCPAAERRPAMGAPIRPSPRKATRVTRCPDPLQSLRSSNCRRRSWLRVVLGRLRLR